MFPVEARKQKPTLQQGASAGLFLLLKETGTTWTNGDSRSGAGNVPVVSATLVVADSKGAIKDHQDGVERTRELP